jgi:salicylate hydroxylase
MPGHDIPKQTATIPLRVVVIGGNVGGVAAAYTLQAAGHSVVVVEKSDGQQPVSDDLPP